MGYKRPLRGPEISHVFNVGAAPHAPYVGERRLRLRLSAHAVVGLPGVALLL
jgi:hypothetical protein